MDKLSRRAFLMTGTAFAVSGCEVARGAPSRREVIRGADDEDAGFLLEIVTRDRLSFYPHWGSPTRERRTGWPSGGAVPTDQRIAPGDTLDLRIWDAEETSLLSGRNAPFADVANVVVTASGHVTLPYIDRVHVGGLTPDAARATLQEELTAISASAQVQLDVSRGRRNSVEMVGGVRNPGTFSLDERNMPLTSLIAAAGGVDGSLSNPQVQITRGSSVFRRPLDFVLDRPAHDPALQGGDRILISSDTRSFKALGAAGREDVITFDGEKVSALHGLSLMGGLTDTRADPKGLLVLRKYDKPVQTQPEGPFRDRVVFSFDLTSAEGMFDADEFLLQDGDIVVATQAFITTVQRIFGVFRDTVGTGRTLQSL